MKNIILLFILLGLFTHCQEGTTSASQTVKDKNELYKALKSAQAGDDIVLANGVWEDVRIRMKHNGTKDKPIKLRAETPGKVMIQGLSDLKLGGDYIIVDGLHFKNGRGPSKSVISFFIDDDTVANHCQVTNCVIEDYNQLQRNHQDLWVVFKGRHNQLDHCYISGKSNRGPTIRVDLAGNKSIKNFHKIIDNHFGPRPPKGGPSAETIQIGNSYTSMCPSNTLVANNFFEACNGEVEVISSKTNFNEFRNNVFYKSEGSLVTRHGNYCIVNGNYFIGDTTSEQIGGVRLIGTGHRVTNNYFYNLKGQNFRSPLAVMNGIPKSPLNRYIQVTDVVVAYNSWIDCKSPLQFGVGSNVSQKDVLPASEIRSARPIRTLVANNLIYNKAFDADPIVAHDELDGIQFKSNIINSHEKNKLTTKDLIPKSFDISNIGEALWMPSGPISDLGLYIGFEFDQFSKDLFGNTRKGVNNAGAIAKQPATVPSFDDRKQYGPTWFNAQSNTDKKEVIRLATGQDLIAAIKSAPIGSIVELAAGNYELKTSIAIDKQLTVRCSEKGKQATINYTGAVGTPLFELHPKGHLDLEDISLQGTSTQHAFASLKNNMSSSYNLSVKNCMINKFDYILKAYKYSFAQHINFVNTTLSNCKNGIELSEETEDKGEYNAENILISNCQFTQIDQNVIDYYRGGYDESTVGGSLIIENSRFTNCGKKEKNGVLLNTYGIINVNIEGNTFVNNNVKLVALLWGAKNNKHSNNTINRSGKIVVEENLKLNLLY